MNWDFSNWWVLCATYRPLDCLRKRKLPRALKKQVKPAKLVRTLTSNQEGRHKVSTVEATADSSSSEDDSTGVRVDHEDSCEGRLDAPSSYNLTHDVSLKELIALSTSESSSSEDNNLPSALGSKTSVSSSQSKTKCPPETGSSKAETGQPNPDQKAKSRQKSRQKRSKEMKTTESRRRQDLKSPVAMETEVPESGDAEMTAGDDSKRKRYILFVGNIPRAASREDVTGHFERRGVPVVDARLATSKVTGESRGFCFIEFRSPKALQVRIYVVYTSSVLLTL